MTSQSISSSTEDHVSLDGVANYLSQLDLGPRITALLGCCHAQRWAAEVAGAAPYAGGAALWAVVSSQWQRATEAERLEAFSAHPQIGGDMAALRAKFQAAADTGAAATAAANTTAAERSVTWSGQEQAAVASAGSAVLERLSQRNLEYADKFGFIFIVCATGKSAEQMLALLEARLGNSREEELHRAAAEQLKITRIRLEKLT